MEWLMALAIILVVKFKLYVCISFRHHPPTGSKILQNSPNVSNPSPKFSNFPPFA